MITNNVRGHIQLHPYHLVGPSPWPIFTSFSLMDLAISIGLTSHGYIDTNFFIFLSIILVLYSMTLWFKDIIAESTYLGEHTTAVKRGINQGFILFVVSEILIFVSLFWAYLHSALSPNVEIGMLWPPAGIEAISPSELPLLNTIVLLASGVTVTFGHHALINGKRNYTLLGFVLTTFLIVLFVYCQYLEYSFAPFTIADSVYGSTFFSTTGLHGIHMIMLAAMLAICTFRVWNYDFTNTSHVGAETTILYLHVLDIIWLFIYIVMYWWGS